jgi:CHAD domain-containing protein
LKAGDQNLEFLEAEVELVEGSETELGAIVDCLQDEWGLQPSLPSKFERALKFLDEKKPRAPSASMTRLEIDDPIGEAARKTLLCHFRRMLQHEAGTRAGLDPEELHDMRVATRRMRAALEVFGRNLDPDTMKPFGAALRRVGRRLGSVRDLDVFGEKAEKYLDTLPENRRGDLDDLLAAWNVEREARRVEMVTHLDSHGYTQFKQKFAELLEAPGSIPSVTTSVDGEPLPYRVRLILPEVLHWSNARVQAYEEWLVNAPLSRYHQLRISSKGLRYTLEFFSDVLGPAAQPLIESVKRVQDHLGSLADAVVASGILSGFLRWGTWQASDHTLSAANTASSPGAAAYLAARQAEIQELVEGFPAVWAPIASKDFTRHLAELAGSL